ncbi:IucA/IucC family protein [Streptomyces neyagawaensis]|uniref:IucA/IucC family protein n=1 Tax=Streptomyces neyagawaensis TaxID=42238 RepID=UPI0006E185D7|nr:IucA/IucC family protein [Streptomyces neyagawaensis]MCL6732210.1 IucA/IucC family siderophore biosynthesis protein [Streptomyces neyagawaensis]MDE1682296.1 IucA/IucC family protein [Streptomyces neyagawaensis]
MDPVDANPPRADGTAADSTAADGYAAAPLLNCLLRDAGEPVGPGVHRLAASGRLLRVRGTRRPTDPEVLTDGTRRPTDPEMFTGGTWRRLTHAEFVDLAADELRLRTGLANPELPAEMLDSRAVVAAFLTARAQATPPEDPYRRSEQSLITGHPYHPAPKARGGGPAAAWLPYAPEAYAGFPLTLLGIREDTVVEEGDTTALDALGTAPPGYRLLPAHPWQLDLVGEGLAEAFADGRLIRLGHTTGEVWPTAAIRTVYVPGETLRGNPGGAAATARTAAKASEPGPFEPDLFLKFSLDVRITNDVRRLWRHDLLKLRRTDAAARAAFAALPDGAWLSDRGYRTAAFAFEELAVLVRDGLAGHLAPGTTAVLGAALTEDTAAFPGNPLVRTAAPDAWWRAYLRAVVPPALGAFHHHGVVLEAHLQNTLVACGTAGTPVQVLYRDAEGVKLLPDVTREAGWERLVYCLFVNNVLEVAAAVAEHHPGVDVWAAVRGELARHRDVPGVEDLLDAPTLPGKTNLLLRWTRADGADARYLPLPNPFRHADRTGAA